MLPFMYVRMYVCVYQVLSIRFASAISCNHGQEPHKLVLLFHFIDKGTEVETSDYLPTSYNQR